MKPRSAACSFAGAGEVGHQPVAYLHNLHAALAGTGVYAGLVQVAGMVGGSEAARYAAENWDPAQLPVPIDPDDLAGALRDLYLKRDRFERTVGTPEG